MKEYILRLAENPYFIAGALGGLAAGLFLIFIILIAVIIKQNKTSKKIEDFMGSQYSQMNLEKLFVDFIKKSKIVEEQELNILAKMEEVNNKLTYTLQRIGVVRYNPFSDVGGDLSFSIALLDNTYSGFVITGIYTRQGSFTYLKPVRKGRGDENDKRYRLSKEEAEAVQRAIASH
ncbi:MAG: DUF4446 family protein [Clostridiales bacterium]|nr:DUF4446 family protein [Clostridiales bacterium]MCD8215450.1 DUF4446 family protein [Clostridiales bacterium]